MARSTSTRVSVQALVPSRRGEEPAPVGPGARARRRFGGARLEEGLALTEPLGVGAQLDAAVASARRHFGVLMSLSLALVLPMGVAEQLVLGPALQLDELLVRSSIHAMLQILAMAFVCAVVRDDLLGRELRLGRVLRVAYDRPFALLTMGIVAGVLAAIASIAMACILPGLLLTWIFWVAPAVFVLERAPVLRCFSRASQLVTYQLLPGFGRWLGLYAVFFALLFLLQMVTDGIRGSGLRATVLASLPLGATAFDVGVILMGALVSALQAVFTGAVITIHYLDCRVRYEGLDLGARLARRAKRSQGAPA